MRMIEIFLVDFNKQKCEQIIELLKELSEITKGNIMLDAIKKKGFKEGEARYIMNLLEADKVILPIGRRVTILDDSFTLDEKQLEKLSKELEGEAVEGGKEQEIEELQNSNNTIEEDEFLKKSILPVMTIPPSISFNPYQYGAITQEECFRHIIGAAESVLRISSPFIDRYGISLFMYDLLNAARRGVEIRILTKHGGGTDKSQEVAILKDEFKRNDIANKIQIRYYYRSKDLGRSQTYSIHKKLLIADENKCYVGSGEIRLNSLRWITEAGVMLSSEIKPFIFLFDSVWEEAERI